MEKVVKGKRLRKNKTVMTVAEILESEALNEQVQRNQVYGKRLGIQEKASSIFINGLAMPKSEVCKAWCVSELICWRSSLAMVEFNESKSHGWCSTPTEISMWNMNGSEGVAKTNVSRLLKTNCQRIWIFLNFYSGLHMLNLGIHWYSQKTM